MGLTIGDQQNCMKWKVGWSPGKVGYQLALICLQLLGSLPKPLLIKQYAIYIDFQPSKLLISSLRITEVPCAKWVLGPLTVEKCHLSVYQLSGCSFILIWLGRTQHPASSLSWACCDGWIFFFSYQASARWAGLCRQRWTSIYGLDLPAMPTASWRICL